MRLSRNKTTQQDLTAGTRNANKNKQKLIFVWVTRSQRQFEWLCDIVREAEEWDASLETHIFITQKRADFDLRNLLLYIMGKLINGN